MNFSIENLGKIKKVDFELNKLTVICGQNNTNKTYLTYSLYSFFSYMKDSKYSLSSLGEKFQTLFKTYSVKINLDEIISAIEHSIINDFTKKLPAYLAIRNELAEGIVFKTSMIRDGIDRKAGFDYTGRISETEQFTYTKDQGSNDITIVYSKMDFGNSKETSKKELSDKGYILTLEQHLKVIFDNELFKFIPSPHISSVERTGIAVFENELEIQDSLSILFGGSRRGSKNGANKIYSYPLAVTDNIKSVKNYEALSKSKSKLSSERPDIIEYLLSIINGYFTTNDKKGTTYTPKGSLKDLSLIESSSSIRSLLDLSMYLSHLADKDQILIIDEPEMNLHPENQRKLARLKAMLVDYGIYVLVTTHSDFITRELSLLIMLNDTERQNRLLENDFLREEGYEIKYSIPASYTNVYSICSKHNESFVKKEIVSNEDGFNITSFERTIDKMNNVYSLLL